MVSKLHNSRFYNCVYKKTSYSPLITYICFHEGRKISSKCILTLLLIFNWQYIVYIFRKSWMCPSSTLSAVCSFMYSLMSLLTLWNRQNDPRSCYVPRSSPLVCKQATISHSFYTLYPFLFTLLNSLRHWINVQFTTDAFIS